MIKFDLEKALAGKKVITRDGREVAQLVKFKCSVDERYAVTCVIDGMIERYSDSGGYSEINHSHCLDIFMAPKKLSGFVNVYRGAENDYMGTIRKTEGECRADIESAGQEVLMHIDLSQFEEGYGL